jgi:hypothetical protein
LRLELRVREKELLLKERDLESSRDVWARTLTSPVIVGILAATLGFLGNVLATFLQGESNLAPTASTITRHIGGPHRLEAYSETSFTPLRAVSRLASR